MDEFKALLKKFEEPGAETETEKTKPAIMVVDDDSSILRGLNRVLSNLYKVYLAKSAQEGINTFKNHIACIILDIKMREVSGFEAYKRFKALDPLVPIVFYTAYQSDHDLSAVINQYKPEGYVEKGGNIDVLINLVKESIQKCHLARANQIQQQQLQRAVSELKNEIEKRKKIESQLKRKGERLNTEKIKLEEVNTALKVLMSQLKDNNKELEENILANVKESILPLIKKVDNGQLSQRQKKMLAMIQENLANLVSPFIKTLNSDYLNLTPGEIQVADLVRSGKNTKQIADILSLSPRTIEAYRQSIREKMGIKNKKINMRTHLLSYQ